VLVIFPEAPWGSKEWIYDHLVDHIVLSRLQRVVAEKRWLLGVSVRHLGGDRGGARAFQLVLADAQRADDAVAKVYAKTRDLPNPYDDDFILALGSSRRAS
jgi:hypothetical protein